MMKRVEVEAEFSPEYGPRSLTKRGVVGTQDDPKKTFGRVGDRAVLG